MNAYISLQQKTKLSFNMDEFDDDEDEDGNTKLETDDSEITFKRKRLGMYFIHSLHILCS